MRRPHLCLVTPARGSANNGNARTAQRWVRALEGDFRVQVAPADAPPPAADLLLALHARRSAPALQAWWSRSGAGPVVIALTGTDLYHDLDTDPEVLPRLRRADALIVLQDQALLRLPADCRDKTRVVLQSCRAHQPLPRPSGVLRVAVVGHLRWEKAPETVWAVARALAPTEGIRIDHLGAALEPALAEAARATAATAPHYHWHGAVAHGPARHWIARSHLLLHPSRLEGGAHVLMEAISSDTPVLASRVDGNIGMLGPDYGGYFDRDDVPGIVARLRELRAHLGSGDGPWPALVAQCRALAPRFDPARERADLLQAMWSVLC